MIHSLATGQAEMDAGLPFQMGRLSSALAATYLDINNFHRVVESLV